MPHITIPQPCPANWADMTPTAAGRHCAACEKTVVDFSRKTTAEIQDYLAQPRSVGVCGRFRAEQVSATRPRLLTWRAAPRLALSLAAVLALTYCTSETTPIKQLPVASLTHSDTGEIKGVVVDSVNGPPIAGALIVCAADTSYRIHTGADGWFKLMLPRNLADSELIVSALSGEEKGWMAYIPQYFKSNRKAPIIMRHRIVALGEPSLEDK